MHILIAPDSFKESLPALEVAKAIKRGLAKSLPQADFELFPIGDGGEGTLQALALGLHLEKFSQKVTGPFGQPQTVEYAYKDDLAVFEMAAVTGLETIPEEHRDPLLISNQGIGELIVFLAQQGIKKLMIGVGGSSTNDGGIGMAAGLGYEFFDKQGKKLKAIGANLSQVAYISDCKVSPLIKDMEVTVITDVTNFLCGPKGATYVFGPQKGLPQDSLQAADQAMAAFYQLAAPNLLNVAGAGAGGGMAAGLVAFAGGRIISGIDAILDILDFDQRVKNADIVIVGEGRMDRQSLSGKAPVGLARRTPQGIPVIAICGSLSDDLPDFPTANIQAAFPIISKVDSLENTLADARLNLERTARNIGNLLSLTIKKDCSCKTD